MRTRPDPLNGWSFLWPDVTGGNPTADLLTKVRKLPSLICLFEWLVLVWIFIQFLHLKGSDGKEIKAAPTEVTLGFLRATGVDEKHLARKPGFQNPRSEGTQSRHQERGSSSVVFWPVLKFSSLQTSELLHASALPKVFTMRQITSLIF